VRSGWRIEARTRLQQALRRSGYELRRFDGLGVHPLADARRILEHGAPVVFDVGANTGQTITRIRHFMRGATVHSFEPSETAFAKLQERHGADPAVRLNRLALGAAHEERELFENVSSDMSSFLPLGEDGWGSVTGTTVVPVDTLDSYCERARVETIDLLKIDTQGFELEVLRGAARMLADGRIALVLAEVHFAAVYEGAPSFCDVQELLARDGFALVSIYDVHHVGHRAGWCDAMFADARRLA
jgi:FkbM family methyltransferase